MQNIPYIAAVGLVILWTVGYFFYNADSLIHLLLVLAVIAVLLQVIKE